MTFGLGLRNLRRIRQIAAITFRYGLGSIFDQLDLRVLPVGRRRREDPRYEQMSGPRRLRLALAALGPTFIKLGQVLSARPDLLPAEYIAELRHLQDEGPTVPFDAIRGTIEAELGQPLGRLFASFEETPLSSASLGQVHGAVLHTGEAVIVKVLRPGVEEVVRRDIQVLHDLAQFAHRQSALLRDLELPSFARQFGEIIENELVYTIEAHNAERIGRALDKHSPAIFVPGVIWPFTSRRVLTMVRVYGRRVDRLAESPLSIDRRLLAQQFGHAILHQIFVEGLFHGDPHQGNILITDDGRMALLDFGIVGYLDPRTRGLVAEVLERADKQDVDGVLGVSIEIGSPRPETDLASLHDALANVISRVAILPKREFTVGMLLSRTIRAMWLNHVRVPQELALVARALAVGEGVCIDLDPDFDFREVARVTAEEARRAGATIEHMLDRASASVEATARRLTRLPARMDRILQMLERGTLNIRIDDPEADRRISRLARSLNHLALATLATALLLAGTIGLLFAHVPHVTVLAIIGLAAGGTLTLLLVFAIIRPGHF